LFTEFPVLNRFIFAGRNYAIWLTCYLNKKWFLKHMSPMNIVKN
jgi:hypothetical protein